MKTISPYLGFYCTITDWCGFVLSLLEAMVHVAVVGSDGPTRRNADVCGKSLAKVISIER